MKLLPLSTLSAIVVAASLLCAAGATASPPAAGGEAESILKRACARIVSLRDVRIRGHRTLDPGLAVGSSRGERTSFEAILSKPDRYAVHMRAPSGAKHIYATPRRAVLHSESENFYCELPAARTLDALVSRCERDFAFTPPLDSFIVADPLARLEEAMTGVVGLVDDTVEGVDCHKVTITTEGRTVHVWIGKADLLPRRTMEIHTTVRGNPRRDTFYTSYEPLSRAAGDGGFEFVAPAGCEPRELVPIRDETGR